MKKTITLVLILVSVFMIAACSNNQNKTYEALLSKAYEALSLNFEAGDNASHVTTDFRIPLFVAEFPDVALAWTSSEDTIVKPAGLFVRINRPQSDTPVTLTATLSYIKAHKEKDFELNITGYTSYEFTGYYEGLSGLLMGEFTVELSSMIKTKGHATGTTAQVKQVDTYEGLNYNIYTGYQAYGNREHVWPNSYLGSAPEYDLHNLRAANEQVNSTRGNKYFVDNIEGGAWKSIGNGFYPGEEHIGDVARIILYIYIRYNLNIQLVGTLDLFLMWHEMDPVSPFEISRNNKIYGIQNNRNPFIDYPELVNFVFPN